MLHENLNSESELVESRIQNLCLRHRCVHTEGLTHSKPTPSTAADSQQTSLPPATCCEDTVMKLPLWWLLIEKSTECLFPDPWWTSCEECTLEVNFNYSFQQQAHLFCPFGEDSSLCLAQLLHHLVKQAVSILQQIIWPTIFFPCPWIQNLLTAERNPLAHNIPQ